MPVISTPVGRGVNAERNLGEPSTLNQTKDHKHLPLAETMLRAQKETGTSVIRQARDMLALRRGEGKLSAEEYLGNRLFDPGFSMEDKRRFLGIQAKVIVDRLCNPSFKGRAAVRDKIIFAAMMAELGFPVPKPLGFVHPTRSSFIATDLRDREALLGFLRALDGPVFGKPVDSRWSLGAASLDGYRSDSDSVILLGGEEIGAETFADQVMGFADKGYLFQERLVPHPEVARLAGPAIGTIRLLTGNLEGERELLDCAWKIVAGGNVADNFWRDGNMLGQIDPETGTVMRVASGLAHESRTHEEHPDTGEALPGFTIPFWKEAVALVLQAATVLPDLRLIGWDIAVTPDGPVIVEANTLPAFNLHQLASGTGIMKGRFEAFVTACKQPTT